MMTFGGFIIAPTMMSALCAMVAELMIQVTTSVRTVPRIGN